MRLSNPMTGMEILLKSGARKQFAVPLGTGFPVKKVVALVKGTKQLNIYKECSDVCTLTTHKAVIYTILKRHYIHLLRSCVCAATIMKNILVRTVTVFWCASLHSICRERTAESLYKEKYFQI